MLHAPRDIATPSRPFAAVDFGASRFLCRYAEEHIQKTGVAIETQGFTFITSGRKRESLTVRAAGDCRGSLPCSLCNLFLVLLVSAKEIMLLNFLRCWKWSHNSPKDGCDTSSVNLHRSPAPPTDLSFCVPLQCGIVVKMQALLAAYETSWETPASTSLPLYLPLCRSAPVLLW